MGDAILAAAAESGIGENWCLLENQLTCNTFSNGKYMSNIIDDPDGQYIRVHSNTGVTYTKTIGNLPEYSNTVWYNPKGIPSILSLRLLHKHHLVIYNSQHGNEHISTEIKNELGWSLLPQYEAPSQKQKERAHHSEQFTISQLKSGGKEETVHHP